MAVERTISKQRYITAGIITILIFALGLLLGMVVDYERVQALEERYYENELDYRSLQLQFSFLNFAEHNKNACNAFEVAIKNSVSELSDSLEKVETYKENSGTQRESFELIQRRYILDNIRYWMVVEEAKEVCDINRLSVLYFYSGKNCPSCPDQGVILTFFKKKYGDSLLVFPIDVDNAIKEPVLEVIMGRFNITSMPSLVIDSETYHGVVSKSELAPIICDGLGIKKQECD